MHSDNPDPIDALIDAALRNYAEPPAELDSRTAARAILERARQSQSRAMNQQLTEGIADPESESAEPADTQSSGSWSP